eukprot:9487887-Pyramimonas_sp.AAC.1
MEAASRTPPSTTTCWAATSSSVSRPNSRPPQAVRPRVAPTLGSTASAARAVRLERQGQRAIARRKHFDTFFGGLFSSQTASASDAVAVDAVSTVDASPSSDVSDILDVWNPDDEPLEDP